jgi:valyl-tRNA synthetase
MSKSLGTGIDPLEAIDEYGADAVRFGLMAMSSSQDVRYSEKRVEQGRDLANKMWNASRLVLMNVEPVPPAPQAETVEDRWILSRLQRTVAGVTGQIEAYDFAHATLDLYSFFWSEFCDWYLEMVKPRLYKTPPAGKPADGFAEGKGKPAGGLAGARGKPASSNVSALLLHVLEQTLALAHPIMPFVTEEIYAFMPHRVDALAVRRFPQSDERLIDGDAEREVGVVIDATRRLRRYREAVGALPAVRIPARIVAEGAAPRALYERSLGMIQRLARFELELSGPDGAAEPQALTLSIPGASVELLSADVVDAEEARARLGARASSLRAEIERAQDKLSNSRFVERAPGEVVQQERDKLTRYERELAELED